VSDPDSRGVLEPVQPEGWARPRGYVNGMVGEGRWLHVAGQIGWEADQSFASDDFIAQFGRALDNVLAVVAAAGGRAESIASMTVYVVDLAEYRARAGELGPLWRARLGRHFPAMALVAVSGLVEPRARVEIQAVALLSDPPPAGAAP
jgi:enamine deaminase RidA (YjgF/YER057c/UK114 family)